MGVVTNWLTLPDTYAKFQLELVVIIIAVLTVFERITEVDYGDRTVRSER